MEAIWDPSRTEVRNPGASRLCFDKLEQVLVSAMPRRLPSAPSKFRPRATLATLPYLQAGEEEKFI